MLAHGRAGGRSVLRRARPGARGHRGRTGRAAAGPRDHGRQLADLQAAAARRGRHRHGHQLGGGHIAHTGQLFPPETVSNAVYGLSPYRAETAAIVSHAHDRVWTQQHGSEARLKVEKAGHRLAKGLIASVTLAVNPKATPALIGPTSPSP